MFPLVHVDKPNPLDLFQIWLNLPAKNKKVDPHYKMLWREDIPVVDLKSETGEGTVKVTTVTGAIPGTQSQSLPPGPPPPSSWAFDPQNDVCVWTISFTPGTEGKGVTWVLPKAQKSGTNRVLYFFRGTKVILGESFTLEKHMGIELDSSQAVPLSVPPGGGGEGEGVELLLLQGQPIGETVVNHGPFVCSSDEELREIFGAFHEGKFGDWPFESDGPVNGLKGRFAQHPGGKVETRDV
uniref:Pirin C-terminal domain-containing protein n=1 Tax=Chromera velia CCMP2878 TaxID=1169474 RepID=A0A0G4HK31_9ALVE|eukprot:Cvel_28323.t1-p1 / transcript=Cvel_28323.t1 / gene=Cvel_28323 / organism=Chromera_velia_CCMP2878 / gene_product=hypothetical protein / transcript_product=hypothetical protein / location=Cvel_scaffold3682:6318-7031(+) / protein_length=238 / sequence_SO=supercontig / SO=protein_coding / is_pseudo=false